MNVKHKLQAVIADAPSASPQTFLQQQRKDSFLSALGVSDIPGSEAPDETLNQDFLTALGMSE